MKYKFMYDIIKPAVKEVEADSFEQALEKFDDGKDGDVGLAVTYKVVEA